jgi:hypothetical protein
MISSASSGLDKSIQMIKETECMFDSVRGMLIKSEREIPPAFR